jgi:hypothetical protein
MTCVVVDDDLDWEFAFDSRLGHPTGSSEEPMAKRSNNFRAVNTLISSTPVASTNISVIINYLQTTFNFVQWHSAGRFLRRTVNDHKGVSQYSLCRGSPCGKGLATHRRVDGIEYASRPPALRDGELIRSDGVE